MGSAAVLECTLATDLYAGVRNTKDCGIGHTCILGIALELANNRGSRWGISLN